MGEQPDLDVVGFGAVNVDYIVAGPTSVDYFDELEAGEEHHVEDYGQLRESIDNLADAPSLSIQLGGSALNVVRALSALAPDLKLGFVSAAGGSPAELPVETNLPLLEGLVETMVDWHGGPFGTCVSVLDGSDRTLITYNNPVTTERLADPAYRQELLQRLLRGRLVHITSVFGKGGARNTARLMAELRERRRDILLSVDLGHVWAGDGDARDVLRQANYVFCNELELSLVPPAALDASAQDREEYRAGWILDKLSKDASRLVVLKKKHQANRGSDYVGQAGCVMYHRRDGLESVERHEFTSEALAPGRVVDSTGAGDVFAAGVIAALHSHEVKALRALQLGFDAARHKMLSTGVGGYENLGTVVRGESLSPGRGKIFISHASENEQLVRALEDLLHSGSAVPREDQFFCSSLMRQGPRPAENVWRRVWQTLRGAEYVIFVITDGFEQSSDCMHEVGAAAALGVRCIPLVASESTFRDYSLPVMQAKGGELASRDTLTDLHGEISDHFGYEPVENQRFDRLVTEVVELAKVANGPIGAFRKKRPAKRSRAPVERDPAGKTRSKG